MQSYFCAAPKLRNFSSGAAQPQIPIQDLREVEISYPKLPVQQKIAEILSAYDILIENNTRRIKILEEMARTIYREWFVHFRFPGHEKVKMVDSPLGKIPEGWELKTFGDLFEIKYGKNLPTNRLLEPGEFPVYGAGSVIGFYNQGVANEKVTLVTCRGNGSGTVWRTRGAAFITNNSLMLFPRSKIKHWSYAFVELLVMHSNVKGVLSGSAQPQITIEGLSSVKSITSPEAIVMAHNKIVEPTAEVIDSLHERNKNLRSARDLLLPKLISGEVSLNSMVANQ